jgi:hypothetical protein
LPLARFDDSRDHELLVCCTELTTPEAIDRYAAAAADALAADRVAPVAMAHA